MNKSLVQSQFGKSAEAYAESPVHAKGASLAQLVAHVAPEPGWRVLDVATGAGHTALAFAPHVAQVVASDITAEMLATARDLASEKGLDNVSFETADAEDLPFADVSFDCVTSRIAPHHFPDVGRFVAEAARVLKPGGVFGLVDNIAPDRHTSDGFSDEELAEAAAIYNEFEKVRDPSHARALALSEWIERIVAAGLDVTHYEVLRKPMEFEPWADRIHADVEAKARLRAMAGDLPPAARAFLEPHERDGALWMVWAEGLVVARKPA